MAIRPSQLYPEQTDTSDIVGYPYGRALNESVEGDGTGTPLEAAWVSDLWGFLQALLAAGAVAPSGNPDRVGNSDYLTALRAIIDSAITEGNLTAEEVQTLIGDALESFVTKAHTWDAEQTLASAMVAGELRIRGDLRYDNVFANDHVREVLVPLTSAYAHPGWGMAAPPSVFWQCGTAGSHLHFILPVPSGARVTRVSALVEQSLDGGGATMRLALRRITRLPQAASTTGPETADTAPAASGFHLLELLFNAQANNAESWLSVTITSSATVGAFNFDKLHWLSVTFQDPGPRNY